MRRAAAIANRGNLPEGSKETSHREIARSRGECTTEEKEVEEVKEAEEVKNKERSGWRRGWAAEGGEW